MYHDPVMLEASIDGLSVVPGGTYVDATFGGGGHAAEILKRLGHGKLLAFDQDDEARSNLPGDPRLLFADHNFRYLKNFLRYYDLLPVDGILADLGVSSHQFDEGHRGFSTRFDGPLDMRMNRHSSLTAGEVINTYEVDRLATVFFQYGELKQAKRLSANIQKQRELKPLNTTGELVEVLQKTAPRGRENKFMAQAFQALRIEVNNELEALKALLQQSAEVLKPGGRLVVISYHSLEDRLVKNFMRSGYFDGQTEKDFYGNPLRPFVPTGKVIKADNKELEKNPRARSARLRIAEKQLKA